MTGRRDTARFVRSLAPGQPPAGDLLAEQPRPVLLSWARAFLGSADQASAARRFVSVLLQGSPLRDDAVTVVSELFSNAVIHTDSGKPGGLIIVQVGRWRLGARIAVTDQGARGGPRISRPEAPGRADESGHGLFMVRCLVGHLDWHDDASGRTICAILGHLPPGHHPATGLSVHAWGRRP